MSESLLGVSILQVISSDPITGLEGDKEMRGAVGALLEIGKEMLSTSLSPLESKADALQESISAGIALVRSRSRVLPVPTEVPFSFHVKVGVKVSSGSTTLALQVAVISLYSAV